MRVCVWKTGHEIADTVAQEIMRSQSGAAHSYRDLRHTECVDVRDHDTHIAYGILRGTADVFRECERLGKPYIHLDRGYFHPGHYDGYYRVSLRGTQQTGHWLEPDYERLAKLALDIKPWRGFDHSKPVLVCPPTREVSDFFYPGEHGERYTWEKHNFEWHIQERHKGPGYVWRPKGTATPINFDDYSHVLTFNSSVGWQALAAGIPCVSDPKHSIVGAWFNHFTTDDLAEAQYSERERLFATMAKLQMTLSEIRDGKLWALIQELLSRSKSSLASMNANPTAPTSPPTASSAAPSIQSQFGISNIAS